jgi:hypothetical protein
VRDDLGLQAHSDCRSETPSKSVAPSPSLILAPPRSSRTGAADSSVDPAFGGLGRCSSVGAGPRSRDESCWSGGVRSARRVMSRSPAWTGVVRGAGLEGEGRSDCRVSRTCPCRLARTAASRRRRHDPPPFRQRIMPRVSRAQHRHSGSGPSWGLAGYLRSSSSNCNGRSRGGTCPLVLGSLGTGTAGVGGSDDGSQQISS